MRDSALGCEFYLRFVMGEGGTLGMSGYVCCALLALAPLGVRSILSAVDYTCYMQPATCGAPAAAGYACYALLALAPAILEWEEKLRWRALRSGT